MKGIKKIRVNKLNDVMIEVFKKQRAKDKQDIIKVIKKQLKCETCDIEPNMVDCNNCGLCKIDKIFKAIDEIWKEGQ